MSNKPPRIGIPGLNRGAGVPAGYVVGRRRGAKQGPAELLDLNQLQGQGVGTMAHTNRKSSSTESTALSSTTSLSTSVSSSLSSVTSTNVTQSTSLSQISSSLSSANSTNVTQSTSLSLISSSLSGAISTNTGQSTSLSQVSSSLSGAISSTSSLSTAVSTVISTVISGSISVVNSRIDSLSAAGGGGATTFLALTDTPANYTGAANKAVTVKADETGLEFTTPSGGTGQSTSLSQISSSLSGAISSTSSLSSAVSTVVSGSISTVTSMVNSLSTAVGAGSGALVLLATYTGDGTTGTKTFSGISASYADLEIRIHGCGTNAAAQSVAVTVNSVGAGSYDLQRQYALAIGNNADSALAAASWANALSLPGTGATAGFSAGGEMVILDYAGTTFHKTILFRARHIDSNTTGSGYIVHGSGQVRATAAIASVTLALAAGNYATGTRISLYGRS